VIYDDDDPWNQTAADNAEWLIRFKRDVGLAPAEEGPGLPLQEKSWQVGLGGTGFSPPYVNPKVAPAAYTDDVPVKMEDKIYHVRKETAAKFLKSISTRYPQPATVFCSRDLENGLNNFVRSEIDKGFVPSDEALKALAREILGVQETAADDAHLLEKFKAMHGIASAGGTVDGAIGGPSTSILPSINIALDPSHSLQLPEFDDSMLAEFDQELGDMDLSTSSEPFTDSLMANSQVENEFMQNYTDLYKVSAATASPLRRTTSEKLAKQSGFAYRQYYGGISPITSLGNYFSATTFLDRDLTLTALPNSSDPSLQ
jgi:hypothetical protein